MRYQVSNRHMELFNQLFDYTLKSTGLNGVPAVSNLITLININKIEPVSVIDFDENNIKTLNSMCDIVLKSQGLTALGLIMELSSLLSNPLPEEINEPIKEE